MATLLAQSGDVVVVDRVRRVVGAAKDLNDPMWAAAFAFAEGRPDDAREALARGLGNGRSERCSNAPRAGTGNERPRGPRCTGCPR